MNFRRAFTLIELLIVIIIVGIIATLSLSQYQKLMLKAQATEAKQTLSAIADASWRYYIEKGEFPPNNVDFSIPKTLNIEIPKSKYFTYEYRLFTLENTIVELQAYRKEQGGVPGDSTIKYILLIYDLRGAEHLFEVKYHIEGTWYKIYTRQLKNGSFAQNWD